MERRLIIDALAFEYGKAYGYQEYLFNLLEYFYANRSEILFEKVDVICLEKQKCYFQKYADKFGIRTYKCSLIIQRLLVQTLMPFLLKLHKEDLILYTANYSSLLKKSRHLLVIHDLLFKKKLFFPYYLMRMQRELYLPISIKLADKIIAISNFTASDIVRYYPNCKNRISVINNYFNFEKFPKVNDEVRKEDYFISVCSSAYHKNTITLLKAFETYCTNGGTYKLVFVGGIQNGTDLYFQYLKLPVNIRERIQFYHKITNEQLALLYQKARAYISASLFEGLGMPIVEAMYFDLPVLLSDYPVFHEVSLNKGLYFDPLNYEALSKMMKYISEGSMNPDSYSDMVLDRYSEENTSAKYIQIINSLF